MDALARYSRANGGSVLMNPYHVSDYITAAQSGEE